MSPSAVADFIIVQAEGKSWFGKPQFNPGTPSMTAAVREKTGITLSPVYEYALLLVPGPQGQPQMQPSLRPPFGLLSVRSLALPGAAVWVAVADLSRDEQVLFARLLQDTEAALGMARAQAAGLAMPSMGAKIPTNFGGGPRQ